MDRPQSSLTDYGIVLPGQERLKADAVAHGDSERLPTLYADTICYGHGGDSTRLCDQDVTVTTLTAGNHLVQ